MSKFEIGFWVTLAFIKSCIVLGMWIMVMSILMTTYGFWGFVGGMFLCPIKLNLTTRGK